MLINIKSFGELSLAEFHDMIALRVAIFVVEQDCPYQELDGQDPLAWHLLAQENGVLAATLRILPPMTEASAWSIGRVVVDRTKRGSGLGHKIMDDAIDFVEQQVRSGTLIKLSAQTHLEGFYGMHGFVQAGEGYLEDGIPHIPMTRGAT